MRAATCTPAVLLVAALALQSMTMGAQALPRGRAAARPRRAELRELPQLSEFHAAMPAPTPAGACASSPCLHGGSCSEVARRGRFVARAHEFSCRCTAGFAGARCDERRVSLWQRLKRAINTKLPGQPRHSEFAAATQSRVHAVVSGARAMAAGAQQQQPPEAPGATAMAAVGGVGGLGPAWTRDAGAEAPAGEEDMGTWVKAVFTPEQQQRLGVDARGDAGDGAAADAVDVDSAAGGTDGAEPDALDVTATAAGEDGAATAADEIDTTADDGAEPDALDVAATAAGDDGAAAGAEAGDTTADDVTDGDTVDVDTGPDGDDGAAAGAEAGDTTADDVTDSDTVGVDTGPDGDDDGGVTRAEKIGGVTGAADDVWD